MGLINFKNKDNKTVGILEVKNLENGSQIRFDGDIVDSDWDKWTNEDKAPADVLAALEGLTGNLDIYINSGGGSVFAGMAIYNILKRYNQGKKTVYVDGVAGSIASVIAMAGDEIIMPSNSFLMIHKPSCYSWGNANDFKKVAETLDTIETGIINVYASKLKEGADIEEIKKMVDAETWLTGQQAAEYFNVTVDAANAAVAKLISKGFENSFNNIPKNIKEKTKNAAVAAENKLDNEKDLELMKMQLDLL